jgi:hypothetical protein
MTTGIPMTSDLQHVLGRYVERGWIDATIGDVFKQRRPRAAYLLLSSGGMLVPPLSEVQVTARCYRPFRAHKMVVAEGSARFDLTDLKVGFRSQLTRADNVSLRTCAGFVRGEREEVRPDPIRWPLEVCTWGSEVCVRAIMSEGRAEDPGIEFEIILLGEAV